MGFESRLALYYAGIFAAGGIWLPFLPVWLAARGLDERTIGLLLAVAALARMLAIPVATGAADRLDALRAGLVLSAAVAAIATIGLGLSPSLTLMFVAYAFMAAAASVMVPLVDAYALSGLTARGRSYGPVRVWGSVAFILGTLGAGMLLDVLPASSVIWPIAAVYAATLLAGLALHPVAATPKAIRRPFARQLFGMPALLTVIAAAALTQGSHAAYYGFSSLIWRQDGMSGLAVGVLWSIGVLAEIVLFALSARLPAAIGPAALLAIGAAGGVLRWGVMAFDPPGALLPWLQLLHALSFGAAYLGAVHYVAASAPHGLAATAQGVMAVASGLAMAGAVALSGWLFGRVGVGAYAAMAAMAAAGCGLALLVYLRWREPQRPADQPQSAGSGG